MRVILIFLLVIGLSAWGGHEVSKKDRIAGWMLFGFSGLMVIALLGALFGWF